MWMTAVCCTRRASICAARDDPLRDFIPAAPCTRSRGISLSAGASGAAKGKGSALGDEGSRFPRRAAFLRGMLSTTPLRPTGKRQDKSGPLTPMSLAEAEKKPTLSILEHTDSNRTLALEVPGISREGLQTKVAGSSIRSDGR